MADFLLVLHVDDVCTSTVPFVLSAAAEASVDLRSRAIELTRALALRCSIHAGAKCVCDTGNIGLAGLDARAREDERWVELSSNATKRITMCTLECEGWIVVVDVQQLSAHMPTILLRAIRVQQSLASRAPRVGVGIAGDDAQRSPAFDARVRPRPRERPEAWRQCMPMAVSAALRADAVLLARHAGGTSWWIGACDKPRCAVERFAQDVLRWHARADLTDALSCGGDRAPLRCGSQFWVQVRPSATSNLGSSQIDFHFDRDEQLFLNCHAVFEPPFLSTVTYLSDAGAPTLVLPVVHPSCAASADASAACAGGQLECEMFCSFPRTGKHLLFDGRLLHGCPAGYEGAGAAAQEPQGKGQLRISLLVNVWLGHRPLLCEPLAAEWLPELAPVGLLDGLPDELGEPDALTAEVHAPAHGGTAVSLPADVQTEQLSIWCGSPARFRAALQSAAGAEASTLRVYGVRCSGTILSCHRRHQTVLNGTYEAALNHELEQTTTE